MTAPGQPNATVVKDLTANPAPIGLMGFGMTTILLNIHNAGFIALGAAILAIGVFYGGLAQILVGLMEWKKGNTFGATAFTSYGFFWITLVAIVLMPKVGLTGVESVQTMGWFLFLWGLFTAYLFLCTLKMNRVMQFVFGSLTLLFFMLAAGDFFELTAVTQLAGYVGILCGLGAIYAAMAQVVNEVYGRKVIPLFELKAAEPVKEKARSGKKAAE